MLAWRATIERMADTPFIAETAALMGDPARANMLTALLGGRAMTATELSLEAHVAPSTASGHLTKLLDGNLIRATASGRHRYYRLASPDVARLMETLMSFAPNNDPGHRSKPRCDDAMARARSCYDHLAGKLGVALADSLTQRHHVVLGDDGGVVTDAGRSFLQNFGIEFESRRSPRRILCRVCLDWSERRWHIGGLLGVAISERCFELGWTERQANSRAVTITAAGQREFDQHFGIKL